MPIKLQKDAAVKRLKPRRMKAHKSDREREGNCCIMNSVPLARVFHVFTFIGNDDCTIDFMLVS